MLGEGPRCGYDDRVGRWRAKARGGGDLDSDRSMMVQEQIARLKFFCGKADCRGRAVLDLGCGTGFNCDYVIGKYGARRALGIDISSTTIEFGKKTYPDAEFMVGDACDQALDCGHDAWDRILCCEVIEHIHDPVLALDTIWRHLGPEGVAFVSTPNKRLFSLDHEPSPVNPTHIKEFCLSEFRALLESRFNRVEIFGQRFASKILEARRKAILRRNIRDYQRLGRWYWNLTVRRAWKIIRLEPLWRWIEGPLRYNHFDFEFVDFALDDCIWFCALIAK